MKEKTAIAGFAALGHEARLRIFRVLVEAGPEGLPAGTIAEAAGISPSGLTFHAAHLERAGLLRSRRAGRSVLYSADFGAMGGLVEFLTEQCCGGHPEVCRPQRRVARKAS